MQPHHLQKLNVLGRRSILLRPAPLQQPHRHLNVRQTHDASQQEAPTPHESFLEQLSQWSSTHLSHDTLIDVQVPQNLPLQVQASLLISATRPRARTAISWPSESDRQPEFLAQPTLDLKGYPPSASLTFLYWLYNRHLPRHEANSSPTRNNRACQERYNDLLSDAYLVGASVNSPAFQNTVIRALAQALWKEEFDAARSPFPHHSSAIPWARKTWEKANGRAEGEKLAEFAVDVAARRVFVVGSKGMVLTREERECLSGRESFAGSVFASVGGQIGVKGVGIRELGRVGEVEEMG